MRALLVDAYDSFVHILDQYLRDLGVETTVVRKDAVTTADIDRDRPDLLLLGPGPGHPADAGYLPLIHAFAGDIPILGVCLGHQAIGLAYGGTVTRAHAPRHGKSSLITHDGAGCFTGHDGPITVTRYHSLVVAEPLPEELVVTARSVDDEHVMGLRHRQLAVESVQFHPESITTEDGHGLLRNFIARHVTNHISRGSALPEQNLDALRAEIDVLDAKIVELLAARTSVVTRIGKLKRELGVNEDGVRAPDRVEAVVRRVRALAESHQLDPAIVEPTYRALITALTEMQLRNA